MWGSWVPLGAVGKIEFFETIPVRIPAKHSVFGVVRIPAGILTWADGCSGNLAILGAMPENELYFP